MATGFPVKANYATGDVLTAANMNDLSGTLNYLNGVPYNKNAVINGGFDIWQRGTSLGASGSQFIADRWNFFRDTYAAGITVSQQTSGITNIQYGQRVQRDNGNTNTSALRLNQNFENVNSIPYVGQTVTLSFYAKCGANYSSTASALTAQVVSGTGTNEALRNNFTGQATPVNGTATLTTTYQRFTYTGTISSSATQLAIQFQYTPTGTAGAADYFEITGVQLELGSVATPFSRNGATIQGELAACQRYYLSYTSSDGSITSGFATGTTNAYRYGVYLPTSMRTTPSASSVGTLILYDGTATTNITGIGAVRTLTSNSNVNAISVDFTVASGLTQYRPYMLLIQSATFILSAEL